MAKEMKKGTTLKSSEQVKVVERIQGILGSDKSEVVKVRQIKAILGLNEVKKRPAKNFEELLLQGNKVMTRTKITKTSAFNKLNHLKMENVNELLDKLAKGELDKIILSKPPQKHRVLIALREGGK